MWSGIINCISTRYSFCIPASAVMILTGSLVGPLDTEKAYIVQLYSVNGIKPLTVPVLSAPVIFAYNKYKTLQYGYVITQ